MDKGFRELVGMQIKIIVSLRREKNMYLGRRCLSEKVLKDY